MVGLNNIKANDYVNAVVQILCRVVPFRNYFLDESNYSHVTQDPLVVTCECPPLFGGGSGALSLTCNARSRDPYC